MWLFFFPENLTAFYCTRNDIFISAETKELMLSILKSFKWHFPIRTPYFFSCCFIHIWSELWVFRMYISQKPTLQESHRECDLARLSNTLSVSLRKGNRTLLLTHFQFSLNTNWWHWKLIPREFTLQALHNFHYHSVDFSSFPLAESPPSVLQISGLRILICSCVVPCNVFCCK